MADLQSIIKIIFSGDDQVSETTKNVGGALSGIGDIATGIATPFADLANKILILDTAVSAVALVIGVKAVQAANEFGAGIADLNRFLSEGEGNASQYKAQFDDLSVKYGTNVNEIVQSTADWRAANYDVKTSLELTKTALDYSIAGQISAGDATETLKKIVSGMSIANDDVVASSKRMGDVLNYVADSSKTNFAEISTGISLVAPVINQSGASFEQMTSIVSVLAETLQSGSQAGTSLAVIIGQISKPTEDAKKALQEFGVTVDKNGVTQDSFYKTLSKISEKWPEYNEQQKKSIANTLVSIEQVPKLTTLLDNWGIVGQRANDAVTNSTQSMSKEVERALNTAGQAFKSFDQSINLLFITLGTQISPGVVSVVKALTELDVTLKKTAEGQDNPFKPLSDSLNGTFVEFSKVIEAVSKNLPAALQNVDFSGLIRSFNGLFGELNTLFGKFFGEIDITTVEGLSAALQKIIDTGSLLVTTTQGIISAFEPFADAAGRAVDQFLALDKNSQLDFGKFLGSAKLLIDAGIAIGSALIAIGSLSSDMSRAVDVAFGTAKVAINAFQITINGILYEWLRLKEGVLEVGLAFNQFANWITFTDEKFKNSDPTVAGFKDSLAKVREQMAGVLDTMGRNTAELVGGYNQATGVAIDNADKLGKNLIGISLGLDDVKNSANKATGDIQDTATELGKLADIKLDKIEVQFSSRGEAAEAAGQIKKVSDEANMLVPHLVVIRDENQKVIKSYTELTNVIPGVTGGLSTLGSNMDKTKDKAKEAAKESDNFRIKMEELASNERIKLIEARVTLNVAELEAQTKQIQAAFTSLDSTVQSTGDLLGSLFGGLASADTYSRLKIESQIDLENKRRQEALDLQKQLTQAEIEQIQARTRALDRGDSLIKIDGSGLAPQLEAFMWEVLKAIEVRANASFTEYLQGLPA